VYQLLGGKVRDRVRIYCDSGPKETIPCNEESKARIRQIQDLGFTAFKIDIDDAMDPARFDRVNWTATNWEIDRMIARIAFTRELYPKNFDLAVDMHARYDATTGKRFAKEVEPFKPMWLDEPAPAENIDAMREARAPTSTPIYCGENIYTRWGFREILEKRAVGIYHARFSEARRTAGSAQDRRHGAHVLCARGPARSDFAAGGDGHGPCMRRDSQFPGAGREIIQKGSMTMPERPGIGVDDYGARKGQAPGTPWFEPVKRG
jgi:galactonate dehydratase